MLHKETTCDRIRPRPEFSAAAGPPRDISRLDAGKGSRYNQSSVSEKEDGDVKYRDQKMTWVDFHTHVLPGMDDGAKSPEMGASMLRTLGEQGVGLVFATSHYIPHRESPASFLARRAQAAEALKAVAAGTPPVRLGAEIYLEQALPEKGLEPLCLEGTRLLLVEMPRQSYKPWMMEKIQNIAYGMRVTPVIAHVDRYLDWYTREDYAALFSFSDCLYQINMEALADRAARKFVLRLAKEGYPLLPGSDAHNTEKRRPNFDEAELLFRKNSLTPLLSALEAGMEQAGFRV